MERVFPTVPPLLSSTLPRSVEFEVEEVALEMANAPENENAIQCRIRRMDTLIPVHMRAQLWYLSYADPAGSTNFSTLTLL